MSVKKTLPLASTAGPSVTHGSTERNLHEDAVVEQSPGRIFHTISNGLNNMAGYAAQISVPDRWAIVAWVEALQVSRNAPADMVPGAHDLPTVTRSEAADDAASAPATDAHDHGGGDS